MEVKNRRGDSLREPLLRLDATLMKDFTKQPPPPTHVFFWTHKYRSNCDMRQLTKKKCFNEVLLKISEVRRQETREIILRHDLTEISPKMVNMNNI